MSQTTGKTSTYIKNTNVRESSQVQTGFKKTRFLHQATAGDTLIQLTSLVTPTGVTNYSAPSVSDLSQTNLMQWGSNFQLISSIRGYMMQNVSYVITGAQTIKLIDAALDAEIFEGIIDHVARVGTTLVDASPIVSSGVLAAGNTDFNVGTPFQVGLYSSMQHGAVLVYVDGQLMLRNTGNQAPGAGVEGDYYEVHSGGGLGQIIRFNTPDLINDRKVTVVSVAGLVERPNGSFMAVMETLQGQIDAIVPTVAALADVPETDFQAAPNNVDLKSFGDRVLQAELDINTLEAEKQIIVKTTFLKDSKSSGVNGDVGTVGSFGNVTLNTQEGDTSFCSLSSNQFTLNPGKYRLEAFVPIGWNNGSGNSQGVAKLRNITDSTDVSIGQPVRVNTANVAYRQTGTSIIMTEFTVTSPKVFSIQARVADASTTIGIAAGYGVNEIYTIVKIDKVE